MAYKGTQIGPDGRRRPIGEKAPEPEYEPIDSPADEKNSSNQSGGTIDEKDEKDEKNASNQSGGSWEEPVKEEAPTPEPEEEPDTEDDEDDDTEDDGDTFPRHVGGGTYELRSGERVRGKADALEAQIEEDEAAAGDA